MSKTTPALRSRHHWRALGAPMVAQSSSPSDRSFGLTVGGVLVLIGGFSLWRGHLIRAEITAAIGVALVLSALVRPSILAPLAAVWSRIGHALGWFNSRVLLTLMFGLVLLPAGWVSRLFGSDPLLRRRPKSSRWRAYPAGLKRPQHFERWF